MRILVTGGNGFIGKHLVKSLLENGNVVTIFDNFSNPSKNSSSIVDIGAKIIEGDITELQDITNAIKKHDIVVHLAAKISVEESIKNPSETFQVNVNGTKNILIACKKHHVKKLIAASSAAVYGEGMPGLKLTEESKMEPISPYGQSKVKMEQEIKEFVSEYKINYIILRFFNIYGIGQTSEYSGVITKFMERIIQNKSLELFGDGLQTRDFVAVQDVIYSIHNAISSDKNGTYNIASGNAITIKELAELMISLSRKKLEIQYSPTKNGDIRYSQADISSAKDNLRYYPRVQLKEGIKALL
jgi:UDP-glucose 4-epimerase